jgi:hypothetical protein
VAVGAWAVVHSIAGGEKHPFAVVGVPDKLALLLGLRLGAFSSGAAANSARQVIRTRTEHNPFLIDHNVLSDFQNKERSRLPPTRDS